MSACWNGFCIADTCDGVNHVDATGDTWEQRRGERYCLEHAEYDTCATER